MANTDAWNLGVDIAQGKRSKKQQDDNGSTASKGSSSKPVGGLLGLAGKGISTLRRKSGAKGSSGAMPTGGSPLTMTGEFKKGGRVKKTGVYLLHKNEFVIPAGKHRTSKGHKQVTKIVGSPVRKK